MARTGRASVGVVAGLAVLVALVAGAGEVTAQQLTEAQGSLRCGTLGVAARDPDGGPPLTVQTSTQVPVLEASVTARCPGVAVATFTGELSSGVTSAIANVFVVAQCVAAPPPVPGVPGCTPGDSVIFSPVFRIPMALGAGPEARSIAAGGILPPGQWAVNVLVGALSGDIAVEKVSLTVVVGGPAQRSDSRRLAGPSLVAPDGPAVGGTP